MPYAYGKSLINTWNLQYEISDAQAQRGIAQAWPGWPGHSYATVLCIAPGQTFKSNCPLAATNVVPTEGIYGPC